MRLKRYDIKAILADPGKRRELMIGAILFLQRLEGKDTTRAQAERAYDKTQDKPPIQASK